MLILKKNQDYLIDLKFSFDVVTITETWMNKSSNVNTFRMPPKRKTQEAKGRRSTTKKAKTSSSTQQQSIMSANDIQEVTMNVIKTLKEQVLLKTEPE